MEAARQKPMRKFQEAAEQEDQPPEMRLCEEMKVEMKKPLNWFVAEEAVRMEKTSSVIRSAPGMSETTTTTTTISPTAPTARGSSGEKKEYGGADQLSLD
ncbi:hypothetical protein E3N88_31688 [Mikania micrantha]|uniref:Uncharacterized protein n=1 Tax=Mikania micrantha TaxID=192012 RepID=A0A5N6M6D3_9ASTR|nr:hypothetical protein E3N88_31688 [Mikania micrantha]